MIGEFQVPVVAGVETAGSNGLAGCELRRSYQWGLDLSATLTGAGGVGGLLAIHQHSTLNHQTSTHLPCYDGNGNVTELVNWTSTTTVSARYEYSPFGETVLLEGGGIAAENPFRFSTKFQDQETGFYNYTFRIHAPELGRWLNRDPIEEYGGLNLCQPLHNNLICGIDILGLLEIDVTSPAIAPTPNQPGKPTPRTLPELYKRFQRRIRYGSNEFTNVSDTTEGFVGQFSKILILGPVPEKINGKECYVIKKGIIFHNVSIVAIREEGDWGTVGHEMQHIRSYYLMLERVADLYRGITDNVKWSEKAEAEKARKELERSIQSVLDSLDNPALNHAPPGFGHNDDPWGLGRPGTSEPIPISQ